MAVCCRLTTFALTSIALVLFVVSTRFDHKGNTYYETADITISYILLVGAICIGDIICLVALVIVFTMEIYKVQTNTLDPHIYHYCTPLFHILLFKTRIIFLFV